ncbi:DNL zinc finger-domain-containing protein [Hypoxylon sp. FL0543]|nr:DNL zinc finger-domain-containing protein [Hypoxylon sp. FL0543]
MASRSISSLLFNSSFRSTRTISPSVLRPYPRLPRTSQPAAYRLAHAIPRPSSRTPPEPPSSFSSENKSRKLLEPHYELTFTCVPCSERSTHTISKQGYHKGSVLITCPSCRNRHIISDHLNIFGNRKITVEDLMREKGQLVKRGTLGEDGDVEFWEDGTVTERGARSAAVRDELDALSKEQEATTAQEARDPSSQSTDPAGSASAPLRNVGARPSISNAQHTNHVPSTRRQYSTSENPENPENSEDPPIPSSDHGDIHSDNTSHQGPSEGQASVHPVEEDKSSTKLQPPYLQPRNLEKMPVRNDNELLPQNRLKTDDDSFSGVRYYSFNPKRFRKIIPLKNRSIASPMEVPTVRRVFN